MESKAFTYIEKIASDLSLTCSEKSIDQAISSTLVSSKGKNSAEVKTNYYAGIRESVPTNILEFIRKELGPIRAELGYA